MGFKILHIFTNTCYSPLFSSNYNHPMNCEVVAHSGLLCPLLMTNALSFSLYAYWPFVCPLWRNISLNPLPIFLIGLFAFFSEF